MKVKVCGIMDNQNLEELAKLDIEMIGFNFYPKSKRYISDDIALSIDLVPQQIKKVGVFVNASISFIEEKHKAYGLDFIQLHGDESQEDVIAVQNIAPVIKVFRIKDDFDFDLTKRFEGAAYFLFDTYTKIYGGSGKRFDWKLLKSYKGNTPFILAGGISITDVAVLKTIKHPSFYGIDINSGFEIQPGLKDCSKVEVFINSLDEDA